MHARAHAIVVVGGVIAVAAVAAGKDAKAQALNKLPPARAPCSVLSGYPCHPSFCSVFQHGPCFPQYLPPIGQDLRLTVVSTDENSTDKPADDQPAGDGNKNKSLGKGDKDADDHALDTIRQMFAALRACWVPPPKDEARHGMEYTVRFALKRDGELVAPPRRTYSSHDAPEAVRDVYRDAVDAAIKRCTPLRLSEGMAGAVAGRPIAIRFVDERSFDNDRGSP
jgi:hypothetical protein